MGLDMFAYKRNEKLPAPVDFNENEDEEICYWRKHHDLHGWMEKLYREKGGTAESFNVVPVELTLEDLANLRTAIVKRKLPATTGFFFGNYPPDEESDLYDFKFIETAEQAIKNGYSVYYTSWW